MQKMIKTLLYELHSRVFQDNNNNRTYRRALPRATAMST